MVVVVMVVVWCCWGCEGGCGSVPGGGVSSRLVGGSCGGDWGWL